MARNELLTKVAMEMEEWPEDLEGFCDLTFWNYYDRRAELINEPDDAAAKMGITVQQAKRARQRYLIKSRGRAAPRWTDEHQRQALEMLRAGHTKKHVAETLDVSRQTIRRRTRGLV